MMIRYILRKLQLMKDCILTTFQGVGISFIWSITWSDTSHSVIRLETDVSGRSYMLTEKFLLRRKGYSQLWSLATGIITRNICNKRWMSAPITKVLSIELWRVCPLNCPGLPILSNFTTIRTDPDSTMMVLNFNFFFFK